MKKLIFTALLFAGFSGLSAQSFNFGTIAADAGVGFGMYGIRAHSPVNNEDHTGIALVGTLPTVNAEFGLLKFLGVGVHYRRGTYGRAAGGKGRGNDIAFRVNVHLANKGDKFDLPIGAGFGTSSLYMPLSSTEIFDAKGTVLNIHVSPHFYFSKYVGMFVSLGYNKHILNNIHATASDGRVYTNADGATWGMGGVYFEFGVAGKFDLLKKKDKSETPAVN